MNDVQNLIDRQLGILNRFGYDNVLKRLVVHSQESYYGLQTSAIPATLDQDPPIFACRFSEAPGFEHILALANEDGRVAIQDTSRLSTASTLEGFQCHNNAVFDLAWMPRYMNFVTVSGDHTACLWDVAEGSPKRVLVFSSHTRSVKTAAFPPHSPSIFATGARDGHALLWDVRASTQPTVVLKPDNCLMNCHSSFTPKTPGSHTKRPRIDNHRAISITGLVFQDDLTLISCGECDGNIKVWDLRKNYSNYTREPLPKHSIPYCGSSTKNGYTNLIVDTAQTRLYASCMDNVIYCFNISTYNALPEQRYIGHENSTFYIKTSLSPDCQYLVSGSSDKNAYIWNVKYSQPIVKLAGHWAEVTCAAWCQKGDMKIVTCSDDARHKIWRVGREEWNAEEESELKGRAEVVPRADIVLPLWGSLDKTPSSIKRKLTNTPSTYNIKKVKTGESATKTKRCLNYLLTTKEEDERPTKRLKTDAEDSETKLLPAGIKRPRQNSIESSPTKKRCIFSEPSTSSDWVYAPPPGSSFMTPTKNYEKKNCKKISPKSPKPISPNILTQRATLKVSPSKVRVITFSTPTKDLPNFVMDGEAPHLKLMSPAKKKPETTNWLTLISRDRKSKTVDMTEKPAGIMSSPKEIPPRRASVDKTPKAKKGGPLFKYFNVASKEK